MHAHFLPASSLVTHYSAHVCLASITSLCAHSWHSADVQSVAPGWCEQAQGSTAQHAGES